MKKNEYSKINQQLNKNVIVLGISIGLFIMVSKYMLEILNDVTRNLNTVTLIPLLITATLLMFLVIQINNNTLEFLVNHAKLEKINK